MPAITNPSTKATEFPGEFKALSMYNLAIASASDTMTLTQQANGISEIQSVTVCVNAGQDSAYAHTNATFSGLVITIVSKGANGLASSAWSNTTANLLVIGK